jgi:hypothetical protein
MLRNLQLFTPNITTGVKFDTLRDCADFTEFVPKSRVGVFDSTIACEDDTYHVVVEAPGMFFETCLTNAPIIKKRYDDLVNVGCETHHPLLSKITFHLAVTWFTKIGDNLGRMGVWMLQVDKKAAQTVSKGKKALIAHKFTFIPLVSFLEVYTGANVDDQVSFVVHRIVVCLMCVTHIIVCLQTREFVTSMKAADFTNHMVCALIDVEKHRNIYHMASFEYNRLRQCYMLLSFRDDSTTDVPTRFTSTTKIGACWFCEAENARRRCSRCKAARYCDFNCQHKDWSRQHKNACRDLCSMLAKTP